MSLKSLNIEYIWDEVIEEASKNIKRRNLVIKNGGSYLEFIACRHNKRTRYTDGFSCSDCYGFIKKGSLEYFMTEGCENIWMVLNNMSSLFKRGETDNDINSELIKLRDILNNGELLRGMTHKEAKRLMRKTTKLLYKNNINEDDSCIVIDV